MSDGVPRVEILSCVLQPNSECVYNITTAVPLAHDFAATTGALIGNAVSRVLARELYTFGATDFVVVGPNRARIEAPSLVGVTSPLRKLQSLKWKPLTVKVERKQLAPNVKSKDLFVITTNKSLRNDYYLLACCNGIHGEGDLHVSSSVRWSHLKPQTAIIKIVPSFIKKHGTERVLKAAIRQHAIRSLTH